MIDEMHVLIFKVKIVKKINLVCKKADVQNFDGTSRELFSGRRLHRRKIQRSELA